MNRTEEENIEKIRDEMVQSGILYGFVDEKTIQLSRKLDAILNTYNVSIVCGEKTIMQTNEKIFYKI